MLVQTPRGTTKGRWETSGTVVDVLEHNSYLVKMDGSGRLSKWRRLFLKPMTAHKDILAKQSRGPSELDTGGMTLQSGSRTGAS